MHIFSRLLILDVASRSHSDPGFRLKWSPSQIEVRGRHRWKNKGEKEGGRRKEKPLAPRSMSLSRGDKQSVACSKTGANDLLIPL